MEQRGLLRNQVKAELKRRSYIFYTLVLLSLLYVGFNFVFGEMGYLRYRELKERRHALEQEIAGIRAENEKSKSNIDAYSGDDFYVEKHAREDFGLSGKDEYVFIYK
jgi:cell division protein FtsB